MEKNKYILLAVVGFFKTRWSARHIAVFAFACIFLITTWTVDRITTRSRVLFFSEALRTVSISSEAQIGNDVYFVRSGEVTDSHGGKPALNRADVVLRLIYASEIARRAPLLSLEGSDLEELQRATSRLQALASEYALIQENTEEGTTIRNDLYPTLFLTSLIDAEHARRAFIGVATPESSRVYSIALDRALESYVQSLTSYKAAYQHLVPDNFEYSMVTGDISKESVVGAITQMQDSASEMQKMVALREHCFSRQFTNCDSKDLLPTPPTANVIAHDPGALHLAKEVRYLRSIDSGDKKDPLYGLSLSACVKGGTGPYYFMLERGGETSWIHYVGDLLLSATKDYSMIKGAHMIHYFENNGATYIPVNPVSFYSCPDVARDYSRIFSIRSLSDFAGRNSFLAPEESRRLFFDPTVMYEDDALSFLAVAIPRATSTETKNEIISLLTQLRENSAGLHSLASHTAKVGEDNLKMYKAGVPVNVQALWLITTQSGFPSLFLTANQIFSNQTSFTVFKATSSGAYLRSLARWSQIRAYTPKEQVMHDLRLFTKIHATPDLVTIPTD